MLSDLALTLLVLTVGGVLCFAFVLLLGWLCGKVAAGLCRLFTWRPRRHVPLDCWLDEMLDLDRTRIVDPTRTAVHVPDPTRLEPKLLNSPLRETSRRAGRHRKDVS